MLNVLSKISYTPVQSYIFKNYECQKMRIDGHLI